MFTPLSAGRGKVLAIYLACIAYLFGLKGYMEHGECFSFFFQRIAEFVLSLAFLAWLTL